MKKLFSSLNFAHVGLLQSLLEAEGIACAIRNEQLSMAAGGVPPLECWPELWVNDEDFGKAQEMLDAGQNQETQFKAWVCPQCGEENEGQFGACWNCGHLIDESDN